MQYYELGLISLHDKRVFIIFSSYRLILDNTGEGTLKQLYYPLESNKKPRGTIGTRVSEIFVEKFVSKDQDSSRTEGRSKLMRHH